MNLPPGGGGVGTYSWLRFPGGLTGGGVPRDPTLQHRY